eukprot:TRINITY_DN10748_c0_g1_i2.p1 TRINITY_DN10748_c0_g1~~TRINITY_DN10748_c0_g1_i2.p1  ORF type:complete len:148 (-),score=22.36 TRINITY_DN10748_c0_g1_i2:197-640(-)
MSEIGRIQLQAFSPATSLLTFIPIQEELTFEREFSLEEPLHELFLIEGSQSALEQSDSTSLQTESHPIDSLSCVRESQSEAARYVNPRQLQRILKLRRKRLQRGWTRFDRKKSSARKFHAMRRKRLPNGRFGSKLCLRVGGRSLCAI